MAGKLGAFAVSHGVNMAWNLEELAVTWEAPVDGDREGVSDSVGSLEAQVAFAGACSVGTGLEVVVASGALALAWALAAVQGYGPGESAAGDAAAAGLLAEVS